LILTGGGSLFFFSLYSKSRIQIWWLILGVVFFSVAASNIIKLLDLPAWIDAATFYAGIGLSFALIYMIDRLNWWALIPAGLIVSLGVIRILEQISPETETGGILFFGLGITFLLLFAFPTRYGRLNWSLIPGVASVGIGFLLNYGSSGNVFSYIGPGLLILSGLFILFFAIRK